MKDSSILYTSEQSKVHPLGQKRDLYKFEKV